MISSWVYWENYVGLNPGKKTWGTSRDFPDIWWVYAGIFYVEKRVDNLFCIWKLFLFICKNTIYNMWLYCLLTTPNAQYILKTLNIFIVLYKINDDINIYILTKMILDSWYINLLISDYIYGCEVYIYSRWTETDNIFRPFLIQYAGGVENFELFQRKTLYIYLL